VWLYDPKELKMFIWPYYYTVACKLPGTFYCIIWRGANTLFRALSQELTLLICPELPGKALGKHSFICRLSSDLQKFTCSS